MYAGFGLARDGDLPDGSQALREMREKAPKLLLTAGAPTAEDAWGASDA